MEEKKENLNNTNQSKSIYISLWQFIKEWWIYGLIVILATLLIYKVQDFYFSKHSLSCVSEKIEELGQMGDFFGGMLNPILAFLSFCLLLITIKIQSKELKNSTEELAKSSKALEEQSKSLKLQNFETTFFNMISLHNEIVNNISIDVKYDFIYSSTKHEKVSISYTKQPNIYTKRKAIDEIYLSFHSFIRTKNAFRKPTKAYDLCHEVFQDILGHYFGNIYQILKFIHTTENIDKEKYSSLFRAQFSSQELGLLFFHCSGSIGSRKFKPLMEEFEFFEHLDIQNDNFDFILSLEIYKISAFGKNQKSINHISIVKKRLEDDILNLETKQNLTTVKKLYLARNYFYKNKHDLAIDTLNTLKLELEKDIVNLNLESKNLDKSNIKGLVREQRISEELLNIKEDFNKIDILMNDILSEKNSFISSSQEQQ